MDSRGGNSQQSEIHRKNETDTHEISLLPILISQRPLSTFEQSLHALLFVPYEHLLLYASLLSNSHLALTTFFVLFSFVLL